MFRIRAKYYAQVTINSFEVFEKPIMDRKLYPIQGHACDISVYTRYNSNNDWIPLIHRALVACGTKQKRIIIHSQLLQNNMHNFRWPLQLHSGDTQDFLISVKPHKFIENGENLLKGGFIETAMYAHDDKIEILKELRAGQIKIPHPPAMFNGVVRYTEHQSSINKHKNNEDKGIETESFGCRKQINTAYEENNGSYGVMFNVIAMKTVYLYGLDFYTELDESDGPFNYQIYIKDGGYRSDNAINDLVKWYMIAHGTLVGAGIGRPTSVPKQDFTPVTFQPGGFKGFYVTLDRKNLRYKSFENVEENDLYLTNNDLNVMAGVGIGSYPLHNPHIFSSRLFIGSLMYTTLDPCPTPIPSSTSMHPSGTPTGNPTSIATSSPTKDPILSVSFDFLVKHAQSLDPSHVRTKVESYTRQFFKTELENDESLLQFKSNYGLALITITSKFDNRNNEGRFFSFKFNSFICICRIISNSSNERHSSVKISVVLLSNVFRVLFYIS